MSLGRAQSGGGWKALHRAAHLTLFVCCSVFTAQAQQDELAVRAAYVFNLAKYVSWPKPHDPIVIGVTGPGKMGPVLDQVLAGKTADGKRLAVLAHPSDQDLRRCDIVYVTESAPAEVHAVLSRLNGRALLTVGEGANFARAGGMVGLVRSGDQMQIVVNLEALRAEKLEMSSRLLQLAVVVSGRDSGR